MASWLETIPTKYLSSIHVFLKVDQLLGTWVTNRTVMACLAVDLMITIYDTWFFFAFKNVFQLNQILKHNWLHWLFTIFSVACTCFGMYCAFMRKPYAARLYFGFFMLDHLFSLPSFVAIYKLKCECIRYDQCEALIAFSDPDYAPLNPFLPPPTFAVKHHIPYQDMPEKTEASNDDILAMSHKERRVSFLETHEGTVQQEENNSTREVEVSVRSFKGLNRLRRVRARHSDDSAGRLHIGQDGTAGTNRNESGTLMLKMPGEPPEDTEKLLAEPFRVWKYSKSKPPPVHFFDITQERIRWRTEQRSCATYPLNGTEQAQYFSEQLGRIRQEGERAPTTNWLETRLFKCIIQHLCMAVSVEVVGHTSGKSVLVLCDLHMQATPYINTVSDNPDVTVHQLLAFQRNEKAIQNDFDPKSTITKDKTMVDGVQILREIRTSTCVCKDRKTGCKVSQDVYGQNDFWCKLPASSAQICEEAGSSLYKVSGERGYLWSDDHCRKAQCACSGLGMPMEDGEGAPKLIGGVWKNRMNLGNKCEKWYKGDTRKWCYVGFDSTCTDRHLAETRMVEGYKVPRQYYSYLACEDEKDDKIAVANRTCVLMWWLTITIFFLRYVLFLPILVILFKFIQNRCGDFYEVEEEYAAIFTSSDEEEGTAGGEAKRASRQSAKKTAAGGNRRNSNSSSD